MARTRPSARATTTAHRPTAPGPDVGYIVVCPDGRWAVGIFVGEVLLLAEWVPLSDALDVHALACCWSLGVALGLGGRRVRTSSAAVAAATSWREPASNIGHLRSMRRLAALAASLPDILVEHAPEIRDQAEHVRAVMRLRAQLEAYCG